MRTKTARAEVWVSRRAPHECRQIEACPINQKKVVHFRQRKLLCGTQLQFLIPQVCPIAHLQIDDRHAAT
jgi:hypothetical protein